MSSSTRTTASTSPGAEPAGIHEFVAGIEELTRNDVEAILALGVGDSYRFPGLGAVSAVRVD